MTKKICKDCGEEKEKIEFYSNQGNCKECFKKRVKENRKNNHEQYRLYDIKRQRIDFSRIFRHRYSGMKARIEGRATRRYEVEGRDICTKNEFLQWCEQNIKQFEKIHRAWKKSNWENKMSPSIDRIDNSKGYTIDNIRWISKSINCKKYNKVK
jgi:hypothetical protein